MCGSDRYNRDELQLLVIIDNDGFEAQRTLHHTDIFPENKDFINYHNSLTTFASGHCAILICGAFSFALILGKKYIYMLLSELLVYLIMQTFQNLVQ